MLTPRLRDRPPPAHTPAPAAHRAPPAPPSLPGDFQDAAAAIERRLADVEQYQVPQLAQCRGPLSFHHELATAVRHELAKARRDLDVRHPARRAPLQEPELILCNA